MEGESEMVDETRTGYSAQDHWTDTKDVLSVRRNSPPIKFEDVIKTEFPPPVYPLTDRAWDKRTSWSKTQNSTAQDKKPVLISESCFESLKKSVQSHLDFETVDKPTVKTEQDSLCSGDFDDGTFQKKNSKSQECSLQTELSELRSPQTNAEIAGELYSFVTDLTVKTETDSDSPPGADLAIEKFLVAFLEQSRLDFYFSTSYFGHSEDILSIRGHS